MRTSHWLSGAGLLVGAGAVAWALSLIHIFGPQAPVQVDDRLGAVLGVDLPLMVRFGRAVLPFRSIADLGPGSLIDMGRSPDEPVDLVVGDRVIARGEVVVVGGNYGVRITELTAAKDAAAEWEARTR